MFKKFLVLVAISIGAFVGSAHAEIKEAPFAHHFKWIAENTQYKFAADIPKSEWPTYEEMNADEFKKEYGPATAAVYLNQENRVITYPAVEKDQRYDAIIVHELIHFIQHKKSTRYYACTGSMESEAYDVQADYLAKHNVENHMPKLVLLMVTMCHKPYDR